MTTPSGEPETPMSTEPEFKELIPIDLSGVTAEAVFGSPFVETPEQMIARRYVCSCHRRKSPVKAFAV